MSSKNASHRYPLLAVAMLAVPPGVVLAVYGIGLIATRDQDEDAISGAVGGVALGAGAALMLLAVTAAVVLKRLRP